MKLRDFFFILLGGAIFFVAGRLAQGFGLGIAQLCIKDKHLSARFKKAVANHICADIGDICEEDNQSR